MSFKLPHYIRCNDTTTLIGKLKDLKTAREVHTRRKFRQLPNSTSQKENQEDLDRKTAGSQDIETESETEESVKEKWKAFTKRRKREHSGSRRVYVQSLRVCCPSHSPL